MSNIKQRLKAGAKYAWQSYIMVGIMAALLPFFFHWAVISVAVACVVVAVVATIYGFKRGPFVYMMDNLGIKVVIHRDPEIANRLKSIESDIYSFYIWWWSSEETKAKLEDLKGYILVIVNMEGRAGAHYSVGKTIMIDPDHLNKDTLCYEFGHALMYAELARGNKSVPPVGAGHEREWHEWREKMNLMTFPYG